MGPQTDAILAYQGAQGDGKAFALLIRRHEGALVALIRHEVSDAGHAEDLLQETLLDAWTGLPRLRDPEKARAWLLQIARNRCRDFIKSGQRRIAPVEADELEALAGRFGRGSAAQPEVVSEVVEALDSASPQEREVARLFYLQGFTIAEIAKRQNRPQGTVKRHLFDAREHVRRALGVPDIRRKERAMSLHRKGEKKQVLPVRRPDVTVKPSREKPFAVDCREGAWWFGIPEVGNRTLWGMYDPPEETGRNYWRITWAYDQQTVRPARIHDLDGVEINVDEWNVDTGWMPSTRTMYARITDETVEWMAVSYIEDGKRTLVSYLDEGFDKGWGPPMVRHIADRGGFVRQEDGSYVLAEHAPGEIGAGMFEVSIGAHAFTCLRVIDIYGEPSEERTLMEAFLTRDGRTVLCRRYNGRRWKVGKVKQYDKNWDEKFPEHQRLVINGVTYVHWYDCLTDRSLGISAES